MEFLQAKLNDESGKRQRAEERCRVLKNYSEKSKVLLCLFCFISCGYVSLGNICFF